MSSNAVRTAAAVLLFLFSFGASTAHAQLTKASIESQSQRAFEQMKRQIPLGKDGRQIAMVSCVAWAIIDTLDPPHDALNWEVVLFDHSSANAFAMPGGKIGVFTGLLNIAEDQDSLAVVIGHEIAHVTADHSLKRARRQVGEQLLVAAATDALGVAGGSNILGLGAKLGLTLPFTRKQESAADLEGLRLMAQAGFDPRASIGLWKKMAATGGPKPPALLSTHPDDDNRMVRLIGDLAPSLKLYNAAHENERVPQCDF